MWNEWVLDVVAASREACSRRADALRVLRAMPLANRRGMIDAMKTCDDVDCATLHDVVKVLVTIEDEIGGEDGRAREREALDVASKRGCALAVDALLRHGFDFHGRRRDEKGDGCDEMRDAHVSEGTPASALMVAVREGTRALATTALAKSSSSSSSASAKASEFKTRDDASVRARYVATIRALARAGADVDARCRASGWTALALSARRGEASFVEALLDDGDADPNARDKSGKTPLMHAALAQSTTTCELLLRFGADTELRDDDGWNAAMHAAFRHPHNQRLLRLLAR